MRHYELWKAAIEFSKEETSFYRTDHLYRLATTHAMMMQDEEKMKYYVKKIDIVRRVCRR